MAPKPKAPPSPFHPKALLFTVHLWLGLASGLLFTLVCATGFLIALHPVLEARCNPTILQRGERGATAPADQTLKNGIAALESTPRDLLIPAEPGASWRLRGEEHRIYLDPHTGEAIGELPSIWDDSYKTLVRLHRWLLLDSKVGRPITGAATLIYLVILASGAGLWITKCYRNLARGLTFRKGVGWKRATYDAHLVLGVYALLPLFLMASTGLYWSYREPYKTAVYAVLDGAPAPPPAPKKEKKKGEKTVKETALPYQSILETVEKELPYPGEVRLFFPTKGESTLEVEKVRVPALFQLPTRDELVLDAKTGSVVSRKPFESQSRARQLLSQMYNLHTGFLWGDVTLILYLLATAVGTSLPLTGTVMWWNRTRAQRRAKEIMARRLKEKPSAEKS